MILLSSLSTTLTSHNNNILELIHNNQSLSIHLQNTIYSIIISTAQCLPVVLVIAVNTLYHNAEGLYIINSITAGISPDMTRADNVNMMEEQFTPVEKKEGKE